MRRQRPYPFRVYILSFLALFSGYFSLLLLSGRNAEARLEPGLFFSFTGDSLRTHKLELRTKKNHEVDGASGSGEYKASMISTSPSPAKRNPTVPPSYKSIDEIEYDINRLHAKHSRIVKIEQIGTSTSFRMPIWGVKISDNTARREDEPRILFVGVHHAREPIGANICISLLKKLCRLYGKDKDVTRWVDSMEIWLVPVVNPDGYKYVLENNLRFPWWRKNLRDNDGDGVFNPLYDGVDLNRNYDYNWEDGGDGKPSSWFYRGQQPFSENETQAVMELARRENFVIGISYHSYGESILFPWGNYKKPPDIELIVDIASEMASKIRRQSGHGRYSILPLNGRVGQSSIWMYGQLRVIDYIVEVGTEYFPAEEDIPFVVRENVKGAEYLLDRMLETGVRGRVFDAETRKPLRADITVLEFAADYVRPRRSDEKFGSFYRLLNPGTFTLKINSKGYYSKLIRDVRVDRGDIVDLEVGLRRIRDMTNGR